MTSAAKRVRKLVPSILSADLMNLRQGLDALRAAGVDWVSVDVMDGHFVPNLSFGPDFTRVCKKAGFFVDSHLMVSNPDAVFPWFVEAGSDIVTVHLEACRDAASTLGGIKRHGSKPGLAIKPQTSVDQLLPYLDKIELALVMTVEPGFGGQKFMADMMPKVQALRAEREKRGLDFWIQVDGGVKADNITVVRDAGADSIVAGSAVMAAPDVAAAARQLIKKIS